MKIVLYHFVHIIFMSTFRTGLADCIVKVTQPEKHLHGRLNQSVSISCDVNTSCPNKHVEWYMFSKAKCYRLDIKTQSRKYSLDNADLHIKWLSDSNNGVYYCAVSSDRNSTNSGAQAIGTGTTLTVEENAYNTGHILLFTLVALLSLYSLIILILFMSMKFGRGLLSKKRKHNNKGDSTRRADFRAVVQELYSKRNLQRKRKNMSSGVSQENKVENLQPNTGREDIYENLNRPGKTS